MNDPVAAAARSAAPILAPDLGQRLPAEVEATLAWTIYNDRRYRASEPPPPDTIARQVRITLRERDMTLPPGTDRIAEVVATEITRQATPPG